MKNREALSEEFKNTISEAFDISLEEAEKKIYNSPKLYNFLKQYQDLEQRVKQNSRAIEELRSNKLENDFEEVLNRKNCCCRCHK